MYTNVDRPCRASESRAESRRRWTATIFLDKVQSNDRAGDERRVGCCLEPSVYAPNNPDINRRSEVVVVVRAAALFSVGGMTHKI